MSKAILVIDMPSKCNGCPVLMAGFYCRAMNGKTAVTSYLNTTKPEWCPLREAPQKKTNIKRKDNDGFRLDRRLQCLHR